jgi:uncharacterized protein
MSESVFLDTSAVYAAFDADEAWHGRAAEAWQALLGSDSPLHTSSYVLVELQALLQRRLGVPAVDALASYVLPFVNITWVDERVHSQAAAALLGSRRREISQVDHSSFILMRSLGLRTALTLDAHFAEQGFKVVPSI